MWPFKPRRSSADLAVEWMPRAIDVAAQKWLEFVGQPFAEQMALGEKIFLFTTGLSKGLRQWPAFKASPDVIFLLIAAKGVERSRTHLRIEIESALQVPLPAPHEMTDEEQTAALTSRLTDRAQHKWIDFSTKLHFKDNVTLENKIAAFKVPFLEGVRSDFPMLKDAPDAFFNPTIALGIVDSGIHSLQEVEQALDLKL